MQYTTLKCNIFSKLLLADDNVLEITLRRNQVIRCFHVITYLAIYLILSYLIYYENNNIRIVFNQISEMMRDECKSNDTNIIVVGYEAIIEDQFCYYS